MPESFSYDQVAVHASRDATFSYPQTAMPASQPSTRSRRYPIPPRPRKLSDALPPLNIQVRISPSLTQRLEHEFHDTDHDPRGLRDNTGAENDRADALEREVVNAVMETGTDEKGRRALQKRFERLPEVERRKREVHLAQYCCGWSLRQYQAGTS
jgi:hypothetical protein